MEQPKPVKSRAQSNALYYSRNSEKLCQYMREKIECDQCHKIISRSSRSKHKNSCYPLVNRDEILLKYKNGSCSPKIQFAE